MRRRTCLIDTMMNDDGIKGEPARDTLSTANVSIWNIHAINQGKYIEMDFHFMITC